MVKIHDAYLQHRGLDKVVTRHAIYASPLEVVLPCEDRRLTGQALDQDLCFPDCSCLEFGELLPVTQEVNMEIEDMVVSVSMELDSADFW